jgi:LytS/YehU family sensor histidine kinase
MPHQELIAEISITLLITYFITAIHEAVFFYVQWKENFSKSVQLERDKLEANYETLKAQVNPHFIFNSLNSLATLVDDKKEAIEYIDNLSAFLRFILNPAQKELVYLKEEMDIVYNFIKLQKSRFRDNLFFTILIPDHYEKYLVPPLCIQMLVDNCLKHNIISTDKPLRISITVENGSIIIENNLQRKANKSSTGQGLKNIINRLSFFTIRKVEITENNDIFRVKLPLLTAEA